MDHQADIIETLPRDAATVLARVRRERPKVHCLTNFVAMNISANAMLAVGAVPSMTMAPRAMSDFVRSTRALVVNLGMLDPDREQASKIAVEQAGLLGRPWILDPVKIERSGARLAFARDLLAQNPAAMRANRDEIEALADAAGAESKDELASTLGTVVAETGVHDLVTDGERSCRIANGSPLMMHVTAMGCAASAIVGAFLAVEKDAFLATSSALLVMSIAGEIAGAKARGPGSFQTHLLDVLFDLDDTQIAKHARLK